MSMALDVTDLKRLLDAHEARDNGRFDEMHTLLKEIRDSLKPIAETYSSVSTMGKWGMTLLVSISIIVGIIWGIIQITRVP